MPRDRVRVLQEQEMTPMRRCVSESQVVTPGSPAPSDVFPSLPDVVLQKLGLTSSAATRPW
jgi:hypothetical protein